MDALIVLSELLASGVDVWRERNVVVYEGPTTVVTDEVRAMIREHKAELFELLRFIGPEAEVARYD